MNKIKLRESIIGGSIGVLASIISGGFGFLFWLIIVMVVSIYTDIDIFNQAPLLGMFMTFLAFVIVIGSAIFGYKGVTSYRAKQKK